MDKEGGRAGDSGRPLVRRPSGIGGKSRQQRPPLAALFPGPPSPAFTPRPSSSLPTSSPVPPGPRPLPAPQPALRPPLTGRRVPPEPPPPPGLGPSRRPPPHVPRVAIAFAATRAFPPTLAAATALASVSSRGRSRSRRRLPLPPPGPAGRRLRTTRRGGGGGVPPRPGSRGRAARGARVGGGAPERAGGGAGVPTFYGLALARSRAVPGAPSLSVPPAWSLDLGGRRPRPRDSSFLWLGSRDSRPPRPVPHFGRAPNGAVRTRLT